MVMLDQQQTMLLPPLAVFVQIESYLIAVLGRCKLVKAGLPACLVSFPLHQSVCKVTVPRQASYYACIHKCLQC